VWELTLPDVATAGRRRDTTRAKTTAHNSDNPDAEQGSSPPGFANKRTAISADHDPEETGDGGWIDSRRMSRHQIRPPPPSDAQIAGNQPEMTVAPGRNTTTGSEE